MTHHSQRLYGLFSFIDILFCTLISFLMAGCDNSNSSQGIGLDAALDSTYSTSSESEGIVLSMGTDSSSELDIPDKSGDGLTDSGPGVHDAGMDDIGDTIAHLSLGDASTDSDKVESPCPNGSLDQIEEVPNFNIGGSDIVNVVAGRYNTCVIKSDGSIVCWGEQNHLYLPARL